MGRCPSDSLSTTATEISRITESRILSLLTPSLISACIAGASCGTANGGSPVGSAARSSALPATTTPESLAALARGVRDAVSPMLSAISDAANWKPTTNTHSTVKPVALMRYLVRLVTPPDGTVLDPFMGSGSTGKACVVEGFGFIGIERDAEYFEIAKARIGYADNQTEAGAK
ncbi:MAG: site-specific DNA-methyltransferase [Deltaproteobacteria bacterium]|nr:site-specific DNA-methyltransferase [Deltaproteobacteria bacterium]